MKTNNWVKTKKLTKANSHISGDVIFWIGKKMDNEKPAKQYWAYLYPSGYCVRGDDNKEDLKKWLDRNIFKIEEKMKKREIK